MQLDEVIRNPRLIGECGTTPSKNYADSNLVPRVSHHHNPGGGKMRDPENEAAQREVRGIQASGRDVSLIKLEKRGNAMC